MREFSDRRDRTTWAAAYSIPQHATQPSTPNVHHHPSYPDADHTGSTSLSLATSCLPPGPTFGSPQLHSRTSPPTLLPSLPSAYGLQTHQPHLFLNSTPGPQAGTESAETDQPLYQTHPPSEHLHRPLKAVPTSFTMMTETWFGLVQTPRDAYLLLEACRIGMLYRITRRLTDLERSQIIRPGAVFVWEEKEAGIKRWTDHVRWSPSRVSGAFLIYSELLSASSRDSNSNSSDPLLKQSFSSTTLDGDRLHLIAYYSKAALESGRLPTPTGDSQLREIIVPPGVYPDHRATGGVEDEAVRERQRASLMPRHSNSSLLQTVPSATSADSASSSTDAGRMLPTTPTHNSTPMSIGEVTFAQSHRALLPPTAHHRSVPVSKGDHTGEPKYSPSTYFGGIYPIAQGLPEHNQCFQDQGSRWEAYTPLTECANPVGGLGLTVDHRISYGRNALAASNTPISHGPTLAPLAAWQVDQDRERGAERRSSAPATHNFSGNGHSFHPYSRPSEARDRQGPTSVKEYRLEQTDPRGSSRDPATAPGTPSGRGYTLPSIHQASSSGSMGPPVSSSSEPLNSAKSMTPTRSGTHMSQSPHFVNGAIGGGLYSLQTSSSHSNDPMSYRRNLSNSSKPDNGSTMGAMSSTPSSISVDQYSISPNLKPFDKPSGVGAQGIRVKSDTPEPMSPLPSNNTFISLSTQLPRTNPISAQSPSHQWSASTGLSNSLNPLSLDRYGLGKNEEKETPKAYTSKDEPV